MDFEENLRPKKKQKKMFKVVTKNENLLDQVLEKNLMEIKKNNKNIDCRNEIKEIISKSQLMKKKREKQKERLKFTRGLKRLSNNDISTDTSFQIKITPTVLVSKKKKALKNRESAQKSIEKKKQL